MLVYGALLKTLGLSDLASLTAKPSVPNALRVAQGNEMFRLFFEVRRRAVVLSRPIETFDRSVLVGCRGELGCKRGAKPCESQHSQRIQFSHA